MGEKREFKRGWCEKIIQAYNGMIIGYADSRSINNLMIIFTRFNRDTGWLKLKEKTIILETSYHNGVNVPGRKIVYRGEKSYHLKENVPPKEGILALLREEEKRLRNNFFPYSPY